jgi:type I site-specific restriction endonuclease
VLEKRTQLVASKVWEYLKATDPMAKSIVFCDDQDHAERMRQELVKIIPAAASNRRYVMRITGDDNEGKAQLSYFIDNDEPYPVIATTSRLLSTGVDAKTCKLIVLDQNINSMTEFKQIIGRGTRLREDYQKLYFTIMDFKGATACSLIRISTVNPSSFTSPSRMKRWCHLRLPAHLGRTILKRSAMRGLVPMTQPLPDPLLGASASAAPNM